MPKRKEKPNKYIDNVQGEVVWVAGRTLEGTSLWNQVCVKKGSLDRTVWYWGI